MARHIACLTFDFDAVSGIISDGTKSPTPISRGEFGVVGAERMLGLLAEQSIKSSWFIPGHTLETYPEMSEKVVAAGHEIGHHGWTHTSPVHLSRDEEEAGLVRGNAAIEKISGRPARGYRSPAWDLSENSIELLIKHGFVYESSMMGHDCSPYYARTGDVVTQDEPIRFGPESTLIEMPISWSLDDFPHFEFYQTKGYHLQGLMATQGVLQNWLDDFDYMTRNTEWGVLTYTCHPFVSGRGHRMLMLERLISGLRELGAVFLTMEEAVTEWHELKN